MIVQMPDLHAVCTKPPLSGRNRWAVVQGMKWMVTFMLAILPAACASDGTARPARAANVPPNLRADGPIVARVKAKGVQVYTCRADAAGNLCGY